MKVLDLYSGTGSATKYFLGEDVVHVDINPKFRSEICMDVREFRPREHFDVLWASPPCTEFTRTALPFRHVHQGTPPDMTHVLAVRDIIAFVKPRIFVLENVKGSVRWISPIFGEVTQRCGSRYLWGNFPPLVVDQGKCYGKEKIPSHCSFTAERRAMIPDEISRAFYFMCQLEIK